MPPAKKNPAPRKPRAAKPKAGPEVEANIDIRDSENVAIAAGKNNFAANVKIIFQGGWKPVAVILVVVGLLLGAILWFVMPKKETAMTKQFNVAVAEFSTLDANGKPVSGASSELLASYVSQEIQTQFSAMELEKSISYQVWEPEQTGMVKGDTREERAAAAEALAKKINAYILIYGVLIEDGENSKFQPEFYVNHASFRDASEITGSHEIGRQLRIALPFEGIQGAQNPALAGRVRGLNLITMGLAYYSVDKFDEALNYFQQAAEEPDWVGSGHEIVYLLIGNAYVRKASQTQDFAELDLAEENYALALKDEPDYGRAMIGQANVFYQRMSTQGECNLELLDQASTLLDQALASKDQPASAVIEAKVHFYRGHLNIVQNSCAPNQDLFTLAQQEFTWVTDQYEERRDAGDNHEALQSLASQAYGRLGYLAYKQNDAPAAIAWLEKAVQIASPYYQGFYTALMGDIYAAVGKKDEARLAYEDAIAIAEKNADADSLKAYEKKLDALK